MHDIGEAFNLDSNDKYTAVISIASGDESNSITDVDFNTSTNEFVFTKGDGSTFTKDISSILEFDLEANKVLYVDSDTGNIASSSKSYTDLITKSSSTTQNVSSNMNFTGNVSFAPVRFNNQPSTIVSEVEKIDILGVTQLLDDSANEDKYLMTKRGIKGLIADVSSSTGLDIKGTAGNIIIINDSGDDIVDSKISSDNLFQLDDSDSTLEKVRSVEGSDVDINSKLSAKGGLAISNPITVNYIKGQRNTVYEAGDEGVSLLTQKAILQEIDNAKLRSLTYIQKVLGAVDFEINEPVSPSDGDRYINTNQSNVPVSSESDQTIPANAVCTWDTAAGEWSTQEPSLGWSPLNTDTNTYWRLVEDSSGDPIWEDPGTPGADNDHDALYNVRGYDGEVMSAIGAYHLDQETSDLLLGGGEVTDEHTHAVATELRPGFTPVLSGNSTDFYNGVGAFSEISLPDSDWDLKFGAFEAVSTSGWKSGQILNIDTQTASGVRVGNMFTYNFPIETNTDNTKWGIQITLPTSQYSLVAHVSSNYGESIGFMISNQSSSVTSGKIIYETGYDGGNESQFSVGYSASDIYIKSLANKLSTLNSAYGNVKFHIKIDAYYYSIPAIQDLEVDWYSGVVSENLTPPGGDILSLDNTFTGLNRFTNDVTIDTAKLDTQRVETDELQITDYTDTYPRRGVLDTSGEFFKDPSDDVQNNITISTPSVGNYLVDFDLSNGDTAWGSISPQDDYVYEVDYTAYFEGSEGTLILQSNNTASNVVIRTPDVNNVIIGQVSTDYITSLTDSDEIIISFKRVGTLGYRTVIIKNQY